MKKTFKKNTSKNFIRSGLVVLISVLAIFAIVKAGSLNPSSDPAATFFTLENIYSRLTTNATSTEGGHVFSPGASPAGSLYTLEQIYGAIPTIVPGTVKLNTSYLGIDGTLVPSGGTATTTDVCSTKTYFGANQTDWNSAIGTLSIVSSTMLTSATYCGITGNIATQTLLNTTTTVAAGYYNADNLSTLDLDLAAGNVKSGVNIFGIGGSLTPDGGTAAVADLFNGKTANLTADWSLDIGTLNLACNVSTFNGTTNLVLDAYDGIGGSGANRWCMTDSGTATSSDILSGKIAWVNGVAITGNVTSGSNVTGSDNSLAITIPNGLYSGSKTATATSTTLTVNNIKNGISIFGVAGTLVPSGGTATTTDVCSTKTYFGANQTDWNSAIGTLSIVSSTMLTSATYCGITGNIATRTLDNSTTTVSAGYYNTANLSTIDADLASGNIKSGADIFGVAGNSKVLDTSAGTATSTDILSGKVAFSNGAQITGSIVSQILANTTTTIPAGYYAATDLATGTGGDADLTAGNIKSGINVFGINGSLVSYLYGNNDPAWVLTTASSSGTFNATSLSNSVVKLGTNWGVSQTGTLVPSGGTATTTDVCSTKTYFGANQTDWNSAIGTLSIVSSTMLTSATYCGITGNIITQILSNSTTTVPAGYYAATDLATGTGGDTDLTASNILSGITIFGINGTASGAGLVDTGQTGCWDTGGTPITCGSAYPGQDAEYTHTNSSHTCNPSYTTSTISGVIIVTDNCTGLMWKQCSEGQTGSGCTGTAGSYTWDAALSQCEGLSYASSTDWRLPNVKELVSIANYQNVSPAINTTYFPATQSDYYWSSTTYAGYPYFAWFVYFYSGNVFYDDKAFGYYVRCVRQ